MTADHPELPPMDEYLRYHEKSRLKLWIHRHRNQLTDSSLMAILVAIFFVLAVVAVLVQTQSVEMSFAPVKFGTCLGRWEYAPSYLVSLSHLFVIWPINLYMLRDVRDAFGIRLELILTMATTLASILTNTLYRILVSPIAPEAVISLSVTCWLYQFFIVVVPVLEILLQSYRNRRHQRDKRRTIQSLEDVLVDNKLYAEFRAFSIQDFTVENVMFYDRCVRLKRSHTSFLSCHAHQVPHAVATSILHSDAMAGPPESPAISPKLLPTHSTTSLDDVTHEVVEMYETFIRPGADYEVNLDHEVVADITRRIGACEYHPSVFDQALREVYRMMRENTFPRFVSRLSDSSRGRKRMSWVRAEWWKEMVNV